MRYQVTLPGRTRLGTFHWPDDDDDDDDDDGNNNDDNNDDR